MAKIQSCPSFRFATPLKWGLSNRRTGANRDTTGSSNAPSARPAKQILEPGHEAPGSIKTAGGPSPARGHLAISPYTAKSRRPSTSPPDSQPVYKTQRPHPSWNNVSSFHAVDHPAANPDRAWDFPNPCCREPSLGLVARQLLRHDCGVVPIVPARAGGVNEMKGYWCSISLTSQAYFPRLDQANACADSGIG